MLLLKRDAAHQIKYNCATHVNTTWLQKTWQCMSIEYCSVSHSTKCGMGGGLGEQLQENIRLSIVFGGVVQYSHILSCYKAVHYIA